MLTDELREMINLYFDNELKKGKEPALFEMLANNAEAQDYFSNLHKLSRELKASDIQFPAVLEENILRTLAGRATNAGKKTARVYYYAAAVVVLILCGFIFTEMSIYKKELTALNNRIVNQNETIMQLYNSIPAAVVTAEPKYEIIVKANL